MKYFLAKIYYNNLRGLKLLDRLGNQRRGRTIQNPFYEQIRLKLTKSNGRSTDEVSLVDHLPETTQ